MRLLVGIATLALASDALAFAFIDESRVPDPMRPGIDIPAPRFWAIPAVPAPPNPPVRTLNITFNTAPGFVVPAADRPAIAAAVTTWDNRGPIAANNNIVSFAGAFPAGTPTRVFPDGRQFDLQSIFLHELGHALGLDHPNLADRGRPELDRATASTRGANGFFEVAAGGDFLVGNFNDRRGDDRSLHLVDRDNNPFNARAGVIDKTTFSFDGPFDTGGFAQAPTREVAAAGAALTGFAAIANLEAVMVQGQRSLQTKRELTRDDLHGMAYLQAGPDQLSGTADDYAFSLVFNPAGVASAGGAAPAGTQILFSNAPIPAGRLGQTTYARPFTGAMVFYSFDEDTGDILAQTDVWLDGPTFSPGSQIQFVDVTYFDLPGPSVFATPIPSTGWLQMVALLLMAVSYFTGRRVGGKPTEIGDRPRFPQNSGLSPVFTGA